jgi:transcriptional regulator with XRE-family HTH domain
MAKVIIGQEIKRIVKKRGITVEELAQALNVSKPNVFDIYRRESIDTGLLERLCKVLNYNFFKSYYLQYQTEPEKETIELYKEQVDFLKNIIHEKEELYKVLIKVIEKKA